MSQVTIDNGYKPSPDDFRLGWTNAALADTASRNAEEADRYRAAAEATADVAWAEEATARAAYWGEVARCMRAELARRGAC